MLFNFYLFIPLFLYLFIYFITLPREQIFVILKHRRQDYTAEDLP